MESDWVIQPFVAEDLMQVVELWNICLPFDKVTREQLLQLCALPQCDPEGIFMAESKRDIVGFLLPILSSNEQYKKIAWILSLVVRRDYEESGVGEGLIKGAIQFAKSKGKEIIEIATCKEFRFFSHFDSRYNSSITLLERMGFEKMRELVDISKSLTGFQIPYWLSELEEHLRSEGIRFDYCDGIYQSKLLVFIQDNFW